VIVERGAAAAHVLAQQHERCDPAVAFPLYPRDLLAVDGLPAEDRLRLFPRAAKLRFVDARNASGRDEPRELGRRIRARDHDHVDVSPALPPVPVQKLRAAPARVRFVEIVEHEEARSG
jgi:hypothetical protein